MHTCQTPGHLSDLQPASKLRRVYILIEEYLPGLADNPAAECHFTSMCPYRRKLNGSTIYVENDIFNEL